MLVHGSIDENGKISGGRLGDQTEKEVCIKQWYSKPWNVMLRYPKKSVALKAAKIAVKLANSNLVGYDQSNRNSLYAELKKNGFNAAKYIKTGVKTETDCSAFVYACYACAIKELRSDNNAPTTSTMRARYIDVGFEPHFESQYLTTEAYLIPGDIVLKEGSHVAMEGTLNAVQYFPKYKGKSLSIIEALDAVGSKDLSFKYRTIIASVNGILSYAGTASQNTKMVKLLKKGKLIKP